MTDSSPASATGRSLTFWLPLLLGLLLAAPVCFDLVRETDAGWHLALGRLISQTGHIPHTNALSWTYPDQPWYATSWLFGWLGFQLFSHGGLLALQLLTFAFVALTLSLVALACERVEQRGGAWAVPVLALLLVPRITERPDVATWAILAAVVALCLASETRPRLRWWALPLIALGSNFHSGAVFPAVALGVFCFVDLVRGVRRGEQIALGLLGLAALLVNPGGTFNVRYLVDNLHVQNVIVIAEMQSPSLKRAPTFYGLIPIVLGLAWLRRREFPALPLLVLVFALPGVYALRLVYNFDVVAMPALALALAPLRRRASDRTALLTSALVLVGLFALRLHFYEGLEFGPRWDERELPVRAANFVAEHRLAGPHFNAFRDGGYLALALPDRPVFQDGRVQAYPPAFFREEQDAESSPEAFRAWLRGRGVEWAIASRMHERLAANGMLRAKDWALVYFDEASELYLRRDVARFADLIAKYEYRVWRPDAVPQALVDFAAPVLPRLESELRRYALNAPDDPDAAATWCAMDTKLGRPQAAQSCALAKALEREPDR